MNTTIVGWKEITLSPKAEAELLALKQGQVMAVRMKAVKNGKVQVEFAEKIDSPKQVRSALGLLNKSDKRFSFSSGARRSWETAEPADIKALFGYELPEGESHAEILAIVPQVNGLNFHLQVEEMTESAWKKLNEKKPEQLEYLEGKLKRAGADGNFFYTPSGQRVVSEAGLVTAPNGVVITHTYLEGSFRSAEDVMEGITSTAEIKAVV